MDDQLIVAINWDKIRVIIVPRDRYLTFKYGLDIVLYLTFQSDPTNKL